MPLSPYSRHDFEVQWRKGELAKELTFQKLESFARITNYLAGSVNHLPRSVLLESPLEEKISLFIIISACQNGSRGRTNPNQSGELGQGISNARRAAPLPGPWRPQFLHIDYKNILLFFGTVYAGSDIAGRNSKRKGPLDNKYLY
jgi:hypothetical protein